MKKSVLLLALLFSISIQITAQWELVNSPLASPDIRNVVQHPDGYLIAVSVENEIYRSDLIQSNWSKIAALDSTVHCIKISPQGIIYIGLNGGYAFSTNGGVNWEVKHLFTSTSAYISDIEFGSPNYIFMTPKSDFGNPGVWVSSNAGESWNKYTNGLPTNLGGFVGIEMDTDGNLYVLSQYQNSVYCSIDSGQSWQFKSTLSGSGNDIEIDSNDSLYVVIDGNYLYKSHDLGTSWNLILNSIISDLYIDNFDNLYISSSYNNFSSIIYSSNGGSTWGNIGHNSYSYNLIVSNNTIYSCTPTGLKKSSNNGSNWNLCFSYGDKIAKVFDLLFVDGTRILAGTDAGLFSSDNFFNSWVPILVDNSVNHIKKDNFGNLYASSKFLYKSIDQGQSWEIPYTPNISNPLNINNVFINDSGYIFTIQNQGDLGSYVPGFKSTDFGLTWNAVWEYGCACTAGGTGYSLAEDLSGTLFVSFSFVKGPPGPISIHSIRKKNPTGNWISVFEGDIAYNIYLYENTIYLATQGDHQRGILKTTDSGNIFFPLNNGLTNRAVKQLILRPEIFIALTAGGIFRSLDKGNFWTAINLSGLNASINSIYLDDNQRLYACTDNGIYVYNGVLPVELVSFTASSGPDNVTLNWSTASELNNHGFEIERSFDKTNWVTIGFREGKGTTLEPQNYSYSDDISEFSSSKLYYRLKQMDFNGNFEYSNIVEVEIVPSNFSLSQNYPNPFSAKDGSASGGNPSTTIQYTISNRQFVTLKVYNLLGEEVATLVNEEQSAGSYKIEFNLESSTKYLSAGSKGPASGVYFYQLKAGNFVETKKMIYLR